MDALLIEDADNEDARALMQEILAKRAASAISETPSVASEKQTVTIDGYDPDANLTVNPVRVWKNYDDRMAGVAAVVQHGVEVVLLNRVGEAVQIQTPDGKTGWVTDYFIKEFK